MKICSICFGIDLGNEGNEDSNTPCPNNNSENEFLNGQATMLDLKLGQEIRAK